MFTSWGQEYYAQIECVVHHDEDLCFLDASFINILITTYFFWKIVIFFIWACMHKSGLFNTPCDLYQCPVCQVIVLFPAWGYNNCCKPHRPGETRDQQPHHPLSSLAILLHPLECTLSYRAKCCSIHFLLRIHSRETHIHTHLVHSQQIMLEPSKWVFNETADNVQRMLGTGGLLFCLRLHVV